MASSLRNAAGQFTSAALIAEERRRRLLKITVTEGLIGLGIWGELDSILSGKGLTLLPVPEQVGQWIETAARVGEESIGAPIFQSIFGAALGPGVLGAMQRDAPDALRIIERVIGFTVGLPFGTTEVHDAVKALLGDHAPEHLLKAIEKLPAELGMNFFIPQIMSDVVNTATGVPLREAIAEQTRPFRLEWPQLRVLARAHALTDAELRGRLAKIGVREADMDLLAKIDQQLLPVGDLQSMYLSGLMTEPAVADRLGQLGFSPDDVQLILQLYLHKAETAGGDMLRSVAHQGFLDDHLSEAQYRGVLERINVPPRSIALEVEAAALQKSWAVHQLTVAEIKALLLDGSLTETEAKLRLEGLDYAPVDAGAIVLSWRKAAKAARLGLSSSKVLAYLAHGVLSTSAAYDYLLALGIRAEDARFMVDHPTLTAPVTTKPVTESAIVAGYVDGVIDRVTAEQLLTALPTDPQQIALLLLVADDKIARSSKVKATHKALSEAQIIEAWKLGLATEFWAQRELVTLGYSDADAWVLVNIEFTKENKHIPAGWGVLT